MSQLTGTFKVGMRRGARLLTLWAVALAAGLVLAACGSGGGSGGNDGSGGGDPKLIMLGMSFPCNLVEVIAATCDGARAAAEDLPPGYELEIVTGKEVGDNVAFNNLIQTNLLKNPAGMIIFPAGPAAQTPILNKACDQGVEVIILDSPAQGVKCQAALVGADHHQLGARVGEWLVDNPAPSKEVGVVTQPPGTFESTDDRVEGFMDAVEVDGYEVVATVNTDLTLDKTRTQVTNMLSAHPNIGAIFSANGPIGSGTTAALKGNDSVDQLTVDFEGANIANIESGAVDAVGHQHPFDMGYLAVKNMVKVLEGEEVPKEIFTKVAVVDKTNVDEPQYRNASTSEETGSR